MNRIKKINKLKRTKRLEIQLFEHEFRDISLKAKATKLPVAKFIRDSALRTHFTIRRFSSDERELLKMLSALSNNLNQIARKYNQGDRPQIELFTTLNLIKTISSDFINQNNDRKD